MNLLKKIVQKITSAISTAETLGDEFEKAIESIDQPYYRYDNLDWLRHSGDVTKSNLDCGLLPNTYMMYEHPYENNAQLYTDCKVCLKRRQSAST